MIGRFGLGRSRLPCASNPRANASQRQQAKQQPLALQAGISVAGWNQRWQCPASLRVLLKISRWSGPQPGNTCLKYALGCAVSCTLRSGISPIACWTSLRFLTAKRHAPPLPSLCLRGSPRALQSPDSDDGFRLEPPTSTTIHQSSCEGRDRKSFSKALHEIG